MKSILKDWVEDALELLHIGAVDFTPIKRHLFFGRGRRTAFYRHISSKVENGIPMEEALEKFYLKQIKRRRKNLADIIDIIAKRYENGHKLALALVGFVPEVELTTLASAEKAGKLPTIIDRMLEAHEMMADIKATMLMSIIPIIVYSIALYLVLMVVGAKLASNFDTTQGSVGFAGAFVLNLGVVANGPLGLVAPIVTVAIAIAVNLSLPRWTGSWRKIADRFFPYSFYRDMIGFVWILSFTSLLKAGEGDREILEEQAILATPWLRERLLDTAVLMHNGRPFEDALMETGYEFPNPDLIDDIESMSGQEDFADRINTRVSRWGKEVKAAAGRKVFFSALAFELFIYVFIVLVTTGIDQLTQSMGQNFSY